jgi:uncharacterized membrane protein
MFRTGRNAGSKGRCGTAIKREVETMAEEEVTEAEEAAENADSNGASALKNGLASKLTSKEVLIPLGAMAATAAGTIVARKGHLGDKIKEAGGNAAENIGAKTAEGAKEQITGGGGPAGIAGKVMSKAMGGGGGGNDKPKTRRLQIQRWTDVAVPVDRAWEAWTDFEQYPKFMHRVLTVEQQDDDDEHVKWEEKIWFSKRQWEAEIVERNEGEFIAWKTIKGTSHAGVVSFHELDDRLTRVMVTMDFRPAGLLEKMASGLRFVKRAVQADLARFKSYVEFQEAGLDAPQERLEQVKQEEQRQKDEDKQKKDEDERDRDGQRGSGGQDEGGQDDEEREAERLERLERRAQRREKTTA